MFSQFFEFDPSRSKKNRKKKASSSEDSSDDDAARDFNKLLKQAEK